METEQDNSTTQTISRKKENHWSTGLLKSMRDQKLIVFEDELLVAIYDMYPKATFHYLVCSKEDISSVRNVNFQHLKLLKHMHKVGETLSSKHKEYNFLLGYHAIPSMNRLHLHVISDDFDSASLKTKKHWNSFTTDYFLQSESLIEELEKCGKINFKMISEFNGFLNLALKCNKCDYKPKHMPDLKHHLKTHMN